MRRFGYLLVGISLLMLHPPTSADTQESPRPAVHVVVSSDGSVKVIDPKTGKEIAAKVIEPIDLDALDLQDDTAKKPEAKPGKVPIQRLQLQIAPTPPRQSAIDELEPGPSKPAMPAGGLDNAIGRLIKDLEDLRREMKPKKEAPAKKPVPKMIPGGWQRIPEEMLRRWPAPAPTGNVERKLDLILKQMDEMRGDIKNLQDRLPAGKEKKGPGPGFQFEFNPFFPPKGKDDEKKPNPGLPLNRPSDNKKAPSDEEAKQALETARKRLTEAMETERKRAEDQRRGQLSADRTADLEQRLQRVLQEVEALRQEIRKVSQTK